MDGLSYMIPRLSDAGVLAMRRTLKAAIDCVGIGLHSGRRISLRMRPAPSGDGIVFRRTDLGVDIPARWDMVSDTRLCTVISLPGHPEARVGTVEHIMAALSACGVDDALIELDGPEVPVLDGSAAPFVFLLDCAGVADQDLPAPLIEVLRPVRVECDEQDGPASAELRPGLSSGLRLDLSIAFQAAAIGTQSCALHLTAEGFRGELAAARTFTLASEITRLHAAGLGKGGSLDNAIVVDGDRVLNPGGLRMTDEFVRHKLLDAVGDLALAGARLRGRFIGHRSGHRLNNELLRKLFADSRNWRWVDQVPDWRDAAAAA